VTSDYYQAKQSALVARMQATAATELQQATERAVAAERDAISMALKLEVQNAESRKKLDAVAVENRRLVRELGGMRDPGARPDSCGTVPTTTTGTGIAVRPAATGRLSDQAAEFLLEFARDADRAAEYAATCHAWVEALDKKKPDQ
jgi:single-stranded DNA-specific DHH superfamily exonuclease